jgi:hypothetical protein
MSSFCIRFLHNLDTLCTEPIFDGDIVWCYGDKIAIPSQQLASIDAIENLRFHEGVPENLLKEDWPCLIILEDLSNEVYSKEVCHLFTKGSNHRSISVILITQNLFHQGRYCRDITLNAKYLVLLKNVRKTQIFTPGQAAYSRGQCQSERDSSRREQACARLSRVGSFATYRLPATVSNQHIPGAISTRTVCTRNWWNG